jgi:hypothetical protein
METRRSVPEISEETMFTETLKDNGEPEKEQWGGEELTWQPVKERADGAEVLRVRLRLRQVCSGLRLH